MIMIMIIFLYRLVWKNENGAATGRYKMSEDMYNRLDRILACDGQTDGHLAMA